MTRNNGDFCLRHRPTTPGHGDVFEKGRATRSPPGRLRVGVMSVVDLDRRAALSTAALVDSTSPDQYAAPTPCTDWTVRDLLIHLIAGNVKYVEIGRGKEWARGAPDVLLDDDPGAMYRRTMDAMLEAWEQTGALDRETALPVGRGRAELALYLHLGETLVHGWDLARATGQPPLGTRRL